MPYELARAHFEIGRRSPRTAPDRAHHLEEARAVFQQLGCATDLARVQAELGPQTEVPSLPARAAS
jgi:hypothetical protein